MTSLLKRVWRMLNGDLLGREQVIELDHPDLGPIVYFGHKGQGGHWEAELGHPAQPEKFSITLPGPVSGPDPAQAALARSTARDLDALFERCRASFQQEFPKWSRSPWPEGWKAAFVLDGLGFEGGGRWSACWFVRPANHYFTARFENGVVSEVVVDG